MPFEFDSSKEFLRCPASRSELVQDGDRLVCVDREVRLAYPVRDGIPVLLKDEATQLSPEEWTTVMNKAGRAV